MDKEELKPLYYCGNCAHWQDAAIQPYAGSWELTKHCPITNRPCVYDDYCTNHKEAWKK